MRPSSSRGDPDSNRPLRPAWRSDFGLGSQSRVSVLSGNTIPREERVTIGRDISNSRGSSSSMKEGLIGNRLLRPALRSDFGPGRKSSVFRPSGNTNHRGEKFCRCRNITLCKPVQGKITHRNQYIHIFWFKVARYFPVDFCFESPSKPCNSSAQRKIQGVSVKSFAQFCNANQHWTVLFHHDYQLKHLKWAAFV